MLLDALYSTINPIVQASPVIAEFDAEVPVCVYQAESTPIRIKDGIIGYDHNVSIALIDDDLDRINTNTVAIIAAILAMNGNTIESTTITDALLTTENGVIFDKQTNTYQNSFEFSIETNNR